ncbi:TPA: dual specificity protein phosphatase family protein, partial [Yersinia enterocolitica]|nr:dual specificity protein phosphatase family protein [Yersinia enterocolitica]
KASVITKVEDKINSETDILWENLLKFNNENQYLSTLGDTNRYKDIKARISTQLNKNLNANKISIAENHIANAGQYPKDEQIEDHLKMLADNKTSCLVVLASNDDISKPNFTNYFITNSSYATSTLVVKKYNLSSDLSADLYLLKTKDSKGEYIYIPVVHVTNWPDKKPITSSALIKMANLVTESAKIDNNTNKISVNSFDKGLPFVHCKAGVGRTGTFMAEYYMSNHPDNNVSLERIIEDMRISRNNHMVQTKEQLNTLVGICKAQNRPIFKSDEKLNLSVNESEPEHLYANMG